MRAFDYAEKSKREVRGITWLGTMLGIVRNSAYCHLCGIPHSWHACEHLKTASDHAVPLDWYERYRHILRHDPDRVEKVIRALRYLRDKATTGNDDIKRELAYFRKNRHRMRYRQLKYQRLPIGAGVVEAANKVLVTQRLKRSGMRWKIDGGQAVLTFRALIKSDRFDTAWEILMASITGTANDNQDTTAVTIAA